MIFLYAIRVLDISKKNQDDRHMQGQTKNW